MESNELSKRNKEESEIRRAELDIDKARLTAQSTGLKLLLWLIVIAVCGIIACGVLAVLKIAVQALVIVAAILLVIGLVAVFAYNSVKVKIEEHRVDNDED